MTTIVMNRFMLSGDFLDADHKLRPALDEYVTRTTKTLDKYRTEVEAIGRNRALTDSGKREARIKARREMRATLAADPVNAQLDRLRVRAETKRAEILRRGAPTFDPDKAHLRREVRDHWRAEADPLLRQALLEKFIERADREALGALAEDPIEPLDPKDLERAQYAIGAARSPELVAEFGEAERVMSAFTNNLEMAYRSVDDSSGLADHERRAADAADAEAEASGSSLVMVEA